MVPKELSGIVLSRDPAGDRFLRIRIFDEVAGVSALLFTIFGKKMQNSAPDLFDDVECRLKPTKNESSLPFVTDFQKIKSYRQLACKPKFFLTASEIARFYLGNGTHLLDPAPRLKLLRLSLDSFGRAMVPQVVLLKLYFCFARDEGLPVRESWLNGLPNDLSKLTSDILRSPVDQAPVEISKIDEILENLKTWMNEETELRVE